MHYPSLVVLEVTNVCNLKCPFCHFHGTDAARGRPLGHMDPALWDRVLGELETWKRPVTVMTHGAGEPLLYPFLKPLLERARAIPRLTLGFMTNGMLLDETWASFLLDLPVDWLALSIDGVVPETHDAYRVNADLQKIERNLEAFIQARARRRSLRPALDFNMVAYPEIEEQAAAYVARWLPHARAVSISRFRPIGSRRLGETNELQFQPCPLLYHQCVIAYDGRVGLCCEDIHLEVEIGNINEASLASLFNESERLLAYRRQHEEGRIGRLPLCRDCDVWAAERILRRETVTVGPLQANRTITPAGETYKRVA